jgi:hypothetical protein
VSGLAYIAWRESRQSVRGVVRLARGSLLISTVVAGILAYAPQAREAMIVMIEDADPIQLANFGVALLLLSLLAWYSVRVLLYMQLPDSRGWPGLAGLAARNVPRLCGVLPLLAVTVAAYLIASECPSLGLRPGLVAIGGVALAGAVYFAFWVRGRLCRIEHSEQTDPRHLRDLPRATRAIAFAVAALALLCFLAFTFFPQNSRVLGTLTVVLIAASAWIVTVTVLVIASERSRWPVIAIFFGLAFFWSWLNINDNHAVRTVPRPEGHRRPTMPEDFRAWLRSRPDLDEYGEYPVILVAAEGGGIYAASAAALVLARLQDAEPRFAEHVYALSGVSGGSVGCAVFVAGLAEDTENPPQEPAAASAQGQGPMAARARLALRRDLLTPLISTGLFPDLVQQFLPLPVPPFDRARALDDGLEEGWQRAVERTSPKSAAGQMGRPFDAYAPPFVQAPRLFYNATVVETGNRTVISPAFLDPQHFEGVHDAIARGVKPDRTLSVATGAVVSARFPYVTPVATFEGSGEPGATGVPFRLADGGYTDNTGVLTVLDLVDVIREEVGREPGGRRVRLLLIRIGYKESGPTPASGRLSEFIAPIRALVKARSGRRAEAAAAFDARRDSCRIVIDTANTEHPLPLGWLLSDDAMDEIGRQIGRPGEDSDNSRTLRRALDFLTPSPPASPTIGPPTGT